MDTALLLSNISKHISLTTEETDRFISLLNSKSLEAGEFLLREGDICKHETFIAKGCLKTYYVDENGDEHIVDFLIEEWWADDLFSFFTGTASQSNIKAIENTEVLQISKNNLELLYQQIPKFERFFRILFQNAYISQKDISSYLGVTPQFLSTLKKKMRGVNLH